MTTEHPAPRRPEGSRGMKKHDWKDVAIDVVIGWLMGTIGTILMLLVYSQ